MYFFGFKHQSFHSTINSFHSSKTLVWDNFFWGFGSPLGDLQLLLRPYDQDIYYNTTWRRFILLWVTHLQFFIPYQMQILLFILRWSCCFSIYSYLNSCLHEHKRCTLLPSPGLYYNYLVVNKLAKQFKSKKPFFSSFLTNKKPN